MSEKQVNIELKGENAKGHLDVVAGLLANLAFQDLDNYQDYQRVYVEAKSECIAAIYRLRNNPMLQSIRKISDIH